MFVFGTCKPSMSSNTDGMFLPSLYRVATAWLAVKLSPYCPTSSASLFKACVAINPNVEGIGTALRKGEA